jgi:hypothetical protein
MVGKVQATQLTGSIRDEQQRSERTGHKVVTK